jgi:predicted PurR-regulated permease PerM
MHELLVFFSVIGGLKLFGPLGLVVGPVVVAITLALLDIFRKAERRDAEELEAALAKDEADKEAASRADEEKAPLLQRSA